MENIGNTRQIAVANVKTAHVGDKILIPKDGILRKAESIWRKDPWTITTVHMNGTIRIQCGTKLERINT